MPNRVFGPYGRRNFLVTPVRRELIHLRIADMPRCIHEQGQHNRIAICKKKTRVILAAIAALLLGGGAQVSAHLNRNECIQGAGCIPGRNGGTAGFEFTGLTKVSPTLHTGVLTYTDASAGINITSNTLIDYGDGAMPGERLLAYQLSGGTNSEARLFVTDGGATANDTFRIQLLDAASVPVYENAGSLLAQCAGGIILAPECAVQVPCIVEISAGCSVAGVTSPDPSGSCTVNGNTATVTFYYTVKNTGTVAIPTQSLNIVDAFGPVDLSGVTPTVLAPGQQVTYSVNETVTGPFPIVNSVTVNVATGAVSCSAMTTVIVKQQGGGQPSAGSECDDFVTSGGRIVGTPSGAKANFGVHGGIRKGALWGGLNYLDHGNGMHVKSTACTGYTHLSDVGRQITFNVTIDGSPGTAIVKVFDNGEPGRNDVFQIQLSNGYSAGGDLGGNRPGGGNLQLHKTKCGKGAAAKPASPTRK